MNQLSEKGLKKLLVGRLCSHKTIHSNDWLDSLHALRKFGLEAVAMTSNGLALHRRLPELVERGLTHLNLR